MLYARHTDIPGLYDVFTAELDPVASEVTQRQLVDLARRRGEEFEIVPPPLVSDATVRLP